MVNAMKHCHIQLATGQFTGTNFFLTFNHMPENMNSKCQLFTDASIIYREIKSNTDWEQLQQDLDSRHVNEKHLKRCIVIP